VDEKEALPDDKWERGLAMVCATFFTASNGEKDGMKILALYTTLLAELDPKKPIHVDWQRRRIKGDG
jgi:hypothetical protein